MTFNGVDIGHSLGIRLHEYPILNRFEEEVVVSDMVMCIEISQRFEGVGNFHIEDMVLHGERAGDPDLPEDTSEMLVVG